MSTTPSILRVVLSFQDARMTNQYATLKSDWDTVSIYI